MTFQFKIGDKVEFVAGHDIDGVVTAYLVRSRAHVSYEVSWFHNGESKCKWFDAVELKAPTRKKNGFVS